MVRPSVVHEVKLDMVSSEKSTMTRSVLSDSDGIQRLVGMHAQL